MLSYKQRELGKGGELTSRFCNCWKRRGCAATHLRRTKAHVSKMQRGECCREEPGTRSLSLGFGAGTIQTWRERVVKLMGTDAGLVRTLHHKEWGHFTEMHLRRWPVKSHCVWFPDKNKECSQTRKQNAFLLGCSMW